MDFRLSWVEFDPRTMMDRVLKFRCGDAWYQDELRAWLLHESPEEIRDGVKVWLYLDSEGSVVGFGSLVKAVWPCDPEGNDDPPIACIPALALHEDFHGGLPSEAPPHLKYNRQVLSHLLYEAERLTGVRRLVGLFVHDENRRAIALYQSFGFRLTSFDYHDEIKKRTYRFYARPLSQGRTTEPSA